MEPGPEPKSKSKSEPTVGADQNVAVAPSDDDFFTVEEIAARWKLSRDFVRRIFAREPDVLVFSNETPRMIKRAYSTIRISRDVLLRVEKRISSGSQFTPKEPPRCSRKPKTLS
jgi:hypothetical protein